MIIPAFFLSHPLFKRVFYKRLIVIYPFSASIPGADISGSIFSPPVIINKALAGKIINAPIFRGTRFREGRIPFMMGACQ